MIHWSHYLIYQLLLETTIMMELKQGWDDADVQSHYWMLMDCPIAAEA